jgi:flagellin
MASLTRIATNVNALKSLDALNKVNNELSMRQLRLATGSRINSAKEDAAGWVIGKGLEARSKGLSQALSNVGDAQSLLGVAEGGLQGVLDILITMKTKVTQAASDTLGTSERSAIEAQLDDLAAEIDSIVNQSTFNNVNLLDGTYASKSFQIGSETTDTMNVSITQNHSAASLAVADSDLVVTSASTASTALASVNAAITTVNNTIRDVGSLGARLDFKAQALSSIIANTEAAKAQVLDADLAAEQLQAVKLQILQQTATAALAQANTAPQSVLQLF